MLAPPVRASTAKIAPRVAPTRAPRPPQNMLWEPGAGVSNQAVLRHLSQRAETLADSTAESAPGAVHETLQSPGQPLDATTRADFERRFGHDLSRVRIHTGEHAARSARGVRAAAYTVGRDIVFGAERFAP